ncbi:heavy metal-binding domain-containing protein [Puia sp. P3]|uniref:heavy metal-binding domain-containing protein n=1 Tax=Puia sp. P3 TaxID=3423952 RepID=UPI003D67DF46
MKKLVIVIVALLITSSGLFAQDKTAKKDTMQHMQYTCTMHPEVISDKPGKCSKCNRELVVDRRGSKQASIIYTCPMHPDVTSNKPGKCPKCGMELVEKKVPAKGKMKKDSSEMKMNK